MVPARAPTGPAGVLSGSLIFALTLGMTSSEPSDPSGLLFFHLSYCETAVKINTVPNVQGHVEITCSGPNEKQTGGLSEVTLSAVVL